MDILLAIVAVVLAVVGVIGCIVPIIPGVVLSLVGLLCVYFTSYSTISTTMLVVWIGVTVVVSVADYFLPSYMAKLFGGSRAGMVGATIGMIAGMVFGCVVGVILGSFAGAMAGELVYDRQNVARAVKVGFGSFLSFIVGTCIKLAAAIGMLLCIWSDVYAALRGWVATLF